MRVVLVSLVAIVSLGQITSALASSECDDYYSVSCAEGSEFSPQSFLQKDRAHEIEKTINNATLVRSDEAVKLLKSLLDCCSFVLPGFNSMWQSGKGNSNRKIVQDQISCNHSKLNEDLDYEDICDDLKSSPLTFIAIEKDKYDEKSLDDIAEMFEYVRKGFGDVLRESKWLEGSKSLDKVMKKLNDIEATIGFPKDIFSEEYFDETYGNIEVDVREPRKSLKSFSDTVSKWEGRLKLERGRVWDFKLMKTNAMYLNETNSVFLSLTFIRALYKPKKITIETFGRIGSIIGHEIGHMLTPVFVDHKNQTWLDSKTLNSFREMRKCIENIYGSSISISEDLPDMFSYRAALLGYRRWADDNGMASVDSAAEKPFWQSAAGPHCNPVGDLHYIGAHSEGEVRVNFPFAHTPEFSDAFECPIGSNMRRDFEQCK